jgi:hypothetical protein
MPVYTVGLLQFNLCDLELWTNLTEQAGQTIEVNLSKSQPNIWNNAANCSRHRLSPSSFPSHMPLSYSAPILTSPAFSGQIFTVASALHARNYPRMVDWLVPRLMLARKPWYRGVLLVRLDNLHRLHEVRAPVTVRRLWARGRSEHRVAVWYKANVRRTSARWRTVDGRARTSVWRSGGWRGWIWDVLRWTTGSDCLGKQWGEGEGYGRVIRIVSMAFFKIIAILCPNPRFVDWPRDVLTLATTKTTG